MIERAGTLPESTSNRGLTRGPARAAIGSGAFLGVSVLALASFALVGVGPRGESPVVAPADARVIALGKETFGNASCVACHGTDGQGTPGSIPPLAGSEWVLGPPNRLVRIVTQGVCGPIVVKGQGYESSMPSIDFLKDPELAALLTFVRHEWENNAPPVSVEAVAKTRAAIARREAPWKAAELQQLGDED